MSKVIYLLGAGASYGSRGVLPHFSVPFMSSDNMRPPKGIIRGLPILSEFPQAVAQMQDEVGKNQDDNNKLIFLMSAKSIQQ